MGHIRVDLPNTNNKWVRFGLANVDTFIIHVGFGLANVDMIRTLTRHKQDPLTRIATPNPRQWRQKLVDKKLTCMLIRKIILSLNSIKDLLWS